MTVRKKSPIKRVPKRKRKNSASPSLKRRRKSLSQFLRKKVLKQRPSLSPTSQSKRLTKRSLTTAVKVSPVLLSLSPSLHLRTLIPLRMKRRLRKRSLISSRERKRKKRKSKKRLKKKRKKMPKKRSRKKRLKSQLRKLSLLLSPASPRAPLKVSLRNPSQKVPLRANLRNLILNQRSLKSLSQNHRSRNNSNKPNRTTNKANKANKTAIQKSSLEV